VLRGKVNRHHPEHRAIQKWILHPYFGLVFINANPYKHTQKWRLTMKRFMYALLAYVLFVCASAFAGTKPCEELKNEIEEKLKAKGVVNYSLEIVPADQIKDQKVVGSCEGGTKKITYTKDKEK
jgi:hypothetical protein